VRLAFRFLRKAPALAVLAFAIPAGAAPTKSECVDANTKGQVLRKDGKLRAARASFDVCADPKCPGVVRSDCQSRLDDIARAMPSVVLATTDAQPRVVTITLDGESIATTQDAIEVDPGEHHIVIRAGDRDVTRVVTLDEGEKSRRVEYGFEEKVVEQPVVGNPTYRFVGIALASVGVIGLGLGTAFGVASYGAWASVKNECAVSATCDYAKATSDRGTALDFAHASDAAFAIGGAFAVAGAVLFALGTRITVTATPRVIGLTLAETF